MAQFAVRLCLAVDVDGEGGGGRVPYERKVDLPQSGSPRRRIVTVGRLSMDSCPFLLLYSF